MNAGVNTVIVGHPGVSRVRTATPFVLTIVCAGLFSFLSGGYILTRSAPVAILYLLLAAVWTLFLRRGSRPATIYLLALAAFAAFVAWAGLSVLWSFGPDLSWVSFNLAALYLVTVGVLGFMPVRAPQLRLSAFGLLLVLVAIAVYAYLGKVIPDVVTHAHTYARLDSPIGYWNVLALMMVIGIVITLSVAGDGATSAVWRVLAAAGGVPLSFAFFFTLSRGGWVVLLVALVSYFAFTSTRLASFASLAAIAAPVTVVLLKVRGLATLFTATGDDALRTMQGHTLLRYSAAALAVTIVAQAGIVFVQSAVPWPRRVRVIAGGVLLCALILGAGGGSWRFLEARGGLTWVRDRAHAFVSDNNRTSAGDGALRLLSVNTGRPPLWREALEQSRHTRLLGTGAGTFVFSHDRFRTDDSIVKHAHSEWFNVLSELGVVGLVLFVVAMVLFVVAAVRNPFAGRDDPLRPLLVALQVGAVAFVVHISWDWDWDMAAAGIVFFLLVAVCSSYLATCAADRRRAGVAGEGEAPASSSGAESEVPLYRESAVTWPRRAAVTAAVVLLAASWALTYSSARAENAAVIAAGNGNTALALVQARRAASLDPLAVDPLITESLVLQQQGRNGAALGVLQAAARLQPSNSAAYYWQGVLLLNAYGRKQAAAAALERALALNPLDANSAYQLRLALEP